jgi:hypothetical protein
MLHREKTLWQTGVRVATRAGSRETFLVQREMKKAE